jgi:chromate transporter
MGSLGLLATSFYTFLPCFFFVFAGARVVERTQDNPVIRGVLELINVVGRTRQVVRSAIE